ncbi:MAG: hypothetical protein P4L50_04685 [Anaerolineaceae bacterium]|nr:hypothetical protein [Anaerolineaceae bacterium]
MKIFVDPCTQLCESDIAHGLRTTNTTQKNMRKTLLIAGAALAASIISSQAGVYSQNIVGYVNIPAKLGYNNIANPLDCGNSLTNIIQPGPTWDYTLVNIWNGSGYTTYTIDSGMSTGVSDINDNNPVPSPTIKPGQAFFFLNNAASNTLTIVGSVHTDALATGAQTVGSTTNVLVTSPALQFIGSVLPVGGGLASVLQFPTNGPTDYALVQVPVINAAGNITGFTIYTVDSSMNTGFSDVNDNNPVAEPIIPVGSGFFFLNNTGNQQKWVQGL